MTAAESLAVKLRSKGLRISCAESCTGGGIASAMTDVEGSSSWFEYGFVTYANEAKIDILGVPPTILATHGAVSQEVVEAMATGALTVAKADIAISSSGIAGPGGGTVAKPVGTVWLAWAYMVDNVVQVHSQCYLFTGDRQSIRAQAVIQAIREAANLSLLA